MDKRPLRTFGIVGAISIAGVGGGGLWMQSLKADKLASPEHTEAMLFEKIERPLLDAYGGLGGKAIKRDSGTQWVFSAQGPRIVLEGIITELERNNVCRDEFAFTLSKDLQVMLKTFQEGVSYFDSDKDPYSNQRKQLLEFYKQSVVTRLEYETKLFNNFVNREAMAEGIFAMGTFIVVGYLINQGYTFLRRKRNNE